MPAPLPLASLRARGHALARPQAQLDALVRAGELLAAGGPGPRLVVTGRHCFGCTAGDGSSCGGAVAG